MKGTRKSHKKPLPPIIPRCLCSSWIHWLLQIPSPSRFVDEAFKRTNPIAMRYFFKHDHFLGQWYEWKIAMRTCTRNEWHTYRRYYRKETEQ